VAAAGVLARLFDTCVFFFLNPLHPRELTSVTIWKSKNASWGGTLMRGGGGTNLSDIGLNLSGSWQQGHSATYNTPSRI